MSVCSCPKEVDQSSAEDVVVMRSLVSTSAFSSRRVDSLSPRQIVQRVSAEDRRGKMEEGNRPLEDELTMILFNLLTFQACLARCKDLKPFLRFHLVPFGAPMQASKFC